MGYGFNSGPAPINTKPGTMNTKPNAPGGFNTPPPAPGTLDNGAGQHGALKANAARVASLPGGMTREQVGEMQQFLVNHGFQVAVDGVYGPQTKSAAAHFRANHKGGEAWSAANGIGVHPATKADAVPAGRGPAGGGGATGPAAPAANGTSGALQQLLQALLSGGGNVGQGYDAADFGNAAAAPDMAQAAALQRQVDANPLQENQNQADISQWYGLDPTADSYKLSVLGRLAQAKAADAKSATEVGGNMGDLAKSLAGSIGGAANDGSAGVLAAGQNSAGTVAALGQAQSDYESNMDPLLRAEAAGAASREKGANSQALLDLQDKLAQAKGQATADRATGVMGAVDKNNDLAQKRFANQGNLLSLLAQMQAADPNANTLDNAKTRAQIAEINAQAAKARAAATHLVSGASTSPKLAKASLGDLTAQIGGIAGIGADHRIPAGMSVGGIAHLVGTTLQSAGIPKTDPRYQRIAQTIMGSFLDPNGNPLNIPPGWFGPTTQ